MLGSVLIYLYTPLTRIIATANTQHMINAFLLFKSTHKGADFPEVALVELPCNTLDCLVPRLKLRAPAVKVPHGTGGIHKVGPMDIEPCHHGEEDPAKTLRER